MRLTIRSTLLTLCVALTAPAAAASAPTPPSLEPGQDEPGRAELWLRGPFGRIAGGTPERPAAAQPGDVPLDAFSRSAPFVLDAGEIDLDGAALSVTFQPADSEGQSKQLSTGQLTFAGPSVVGTALVVAELRTPDGLSNSRAWLVDVPDRDPSPDGLLDIPAPVVSLHGVAGSLAGALGDGCYIDLCVDVGVAPPSNLLPRLDVGVGEPLAITLSDGSAIVAWDGVMAPLSDRELPSVEAAAVVSNPPRARVDINGLEVPASGDWLLRLRVVFDRERGWMTTSYRLSTR